MHGLTQSDGELRVHGMPTTVGGTIDPSSENPDTAASHDREYGRSVLGGHETLD
jgi:hypothetical protein